LHTQGRCEAGRYAAATTPQSRPANDRPLDPVEGPGCARYRAAVLGCQQCRCYIPNRTEAPTRKGRRKPWWHHEGQFTPGDNALVHIVGRGRFLAHKPARAWLAPPLIHPPYYRVGRAWHDLTRKDQSMNDDDNPNEDNDRRVCAH
jgi:hypothetical protein